MIPHDEMMMLIIGLVALAGALGLRAHCRRIHHWRLLLLGFGVILLGWAATVFEHLMLGALGNYLEHGCYALGALLIAAWCWLHDRRGAEEH